MLTLINHGHNNVDCGLPCSVFSIINELHFWWLRRQRICLQYRIPGCDPWLGRFPQKGNGKPLQNSCLENSMDRGTWKATVNGVSKSRT